MEVRRISLAVASHLSATISVTQELTWIEFMSVSRTVSQINGDFSRKSQKKSHPSSI